MNLIRVIKSYLGKVIRAIYFIYDYIFTYHVLKIRFTEPAKDFKAKKKILTSEKKHHVLFLIEKWANCNPKFPLTNALDNFVYSLESTKLADFSIFHYDEYSLCNDDVNHEVVRQCMTIDPDFIFFTPVWSYNKNISPFTIKFISEELKIPVIMILYDSVYECIINSSMRYAPFLSLIVVLDSSVSYNKIKIVREKAIHLWTPQNPKVFYNLEEKRDIDLSFIGSIKAYPDRMETINFIKANGINIYTAGGKEESFISPENLSSIYRRSKMVINFPHTPTGKLQLKGRTIEATLCGATLIEKENFETNNFFIPMIDYIAYSDLSDLLTKLKYFLSNPEELEKIRLRGYFKSLNNYNANIFWNKIMELLIEKNYIKSR